MNILQVKGIHKIYGEKESQVHDLRDVSFSVKQGGIYRHCWNFRIGKEYAAESERRPGYAHKGADYHPRSRYRGIKVKGTDHFPATEHRVCVSELQSDADAECI